MRYDTTRFVLSCLFGALLLVSPALFSQQASERLTESEHLRLQLQVEKQKRVSAQYEVLFTRFQEQPEVKKLIEEAQAINKEIDSQALDAYAAHKVDRTKFDLNVETGEFVPVAKSGGPERNGQ